MGGDSVASPCLLLGAHSLLHEAVVLQTRAVVGGGRCCAPYVAGVVLEGLSQEVLVGEAEGELLDEGAVEVWWRDRHLFDGHDVCGFA